MAIYDVTFPYSIKYKGSEYIVDRILGTGGEFYTTIQKDGGTTVTFNDTTNETPGHIMFEMGDGSTGAIGDPVAQATVNLDDDPNAVFVLQEGEESWGKQMLQNVLHLSELVDEANARSYLLDNPVYHMGI